MRTFPVHTVARTLMLLASLLAATPATAATGTAPSPERLRALSAALDSATFVSVFARRGTFEARRVLADSAGVHVMRASGRTALIVLSGGDTLGREQRLLRWADVERIDSGRGRSATPAFVGLAIGAAALGTAAVVTRSAESLEPETELGLWFGAALLGTVSTIAGIALCLGVPPTSTIYP